MIWGLANSRLNGSNRATGDDLAFSDTHKIPASLKEGDQLNIVPHRPSFVTF
jgi:hypothetical protein